MNGQEGISFEGMDPEKYFECPKLKAPYDKMLKSTCVIRQTKKDDSGHGFMYTNCTICARGKEILKELGEYYQECEIKPTEDKAVIVKKPEVVKEVVVEKVPEVVKEKIEIEEVKEWKCKNCERGTDVIRKGTNGYCVTCSQIYYKHHDQPEYQQKRLKEFAERIKNGVVEKYKERKERKKKVEVVDKKE